MKNKIICEKIKWIVVFVLIFALALSVFVLFNPNCIFGHHYINGICTECGIAEEASSESDTKNTDSGVVDMATGEMLYSGQTYAMTNMLFSATSMSSTTASEGITLEASIYPSYATNKLVDWNVSFVNPDSEWATGKKISDYVKVVPTSDGALTATVSCLAPFGEQIVVTVVSRDNPEAKAECTLDFARICYGIELKIGEYVLSPGNNYFDFEVSSGKTGVGGVSSCRYILSDTYTIDYYTSEQALAVLFCSSPSKINGTISANAGTGKDNVYLWVAYPNEHTLGDTVTLDRDFIESMNWCGRYDEDSNNPAFVSSSLTDAELTEVLNTSKESGNDCLFGFWVTDFQNQTEEYYYINYNYIDVPVESVSLDNDNVVVNN